MRFVGTYSFDSPAEIRSRAVLVNIVMYHKRLLDVSPCLATRYCFGFMSRGQGEFAYGIDKHIGGFGIVSDNGVEDDGQFYHLLFLSRLFHGFGSSVLRFILHIVDCAMEAGNLVILRNNLADLFKGEVFSVAEDELAGIDTLKHALDVIDVEIVFKSFLPFAAEEFGLFLFQLFLHHVEPLLLGRAVEPFLEIILCLLNQFIKISHRQSLIQVLECRVTGAYQYFV